MDREVVFKALVGSHNYGLATEDSDKDYKVFVIPTFEDLYKGSMYQKTTIGEHEDTDVHDIRKLPHLLFKSNINFLEVLASSEIIMSDDIEIKRILEMKNDIFKMNLPYLYRACKGMHLNKMKNLNKGTAGTKHLVDKYGYDLKEATHAYRVMKVIVDFAETDFEDFVGSIKYEGEDLEFMMDIRNGFFKQDVFERFIEHYYESTFLKIAERYENMKVNIELKEEIDELIMSMIKRKIIEQG